MYQKEVSKKNILDSIFWTSGAKAISQIITLVTTIILTRFISASDFGLMAMAVVYMGLIDTVRDFGILSAIIQRKEISISALSTCFWFLVITSCLLFAVTFIAAPIVATFFDSEQLSNIIRILGLALLFIPSQIIAQGILSRKLRLDLIAKVELTTSILRFIVAVILAINGAGVWSLVYAYIIDKLGLSILLPLLAVWIPKLTYNFKEVKPLLSFGGNVIVSRMLWYIYSKLDFIIIGRLLGSDVLGIYSIASQIATSFLQFITNTIYRVVYPVFSSFQDNYYKLQKVFIKATVLLTTLALPLFLGLAATGPSLVPVLLGNKWQEAVLPLQVLSITAAMQVTSGLGPLLLNAIGKPRLDVYLNLFSFVIMCIGLILGALWMGLNGILLAWLVLTPIRFLTFIYVSISNIQLSIYKYIKEYYRTILPGLLMFSLIVLIDSINLGWPNEVKLGVMVIFGVISYLFLQFVLRRDVFDEIISLLNRKIKPIN